MVVTKLDKANKKNIYNVIIDDKEYALHEEIILKYRLIEGKIISSEDFIKFIEENDYEIIYSKALSYISAYSQSKKLLIKYLENKQYSELAISYTINKLTALNLLDDYNYGLLLLDSYVNQGYGKNMIKKKLLSKMIDNSTIARIIDNINYENYLEALKKLMIKNIKKYEKKDNKKQYLIKYLYSRGYLIDEINSIFYSLGELYEI